MTTPDRAGTSSGMTFTGGLGPVAGGPAIAALLELLPDPAFLLDALGRIIACNGSAAAACDAPAAALLGGAVSALLPLGDDGEALDRLARAPGGTAESWSAPLAGAGALPYAWRLGAVPLEAGPRGAVVDGFLLLGREQTEADVLHTELAERLHQDPLTGLANRVRFRERAERALRHVQRRDRGPVDATVAASPDDGAALPSGPAGHHLAVLFIDLDDFKVVNDSLGHEAGDRLLTEIGARLLKATRGFDLVARLGGDEFAVLLDGMVRDTDAHAVVERITRALQRPVVLGDREVVMGASIGVAYGRDAESADALLRNADVAMYQAKASGKGRFAEFDHAMHAAAVARLELAADLRHAVERDELRLVYQPVVDLRSGAVTGVEALVRWQRGATLLTPDAFVPLAEETALIVPIGQWVLETACRQLAAWRTMVPGLADITLNVNVSGRQLVEPAFADQVLAALAATGIPADRVTLEITETVLIERANECVAVLHALRAHGLRVAIDDFGTGYSSLGYLRQFPVDMIKIDRTFVDRVAEGGSEAALTRTILGLGEALGLEAVAEGIETGAQQDALTALGCTRGQGYHFARPLSASAFAAHAASAARPIAPLQTCPD